MEVEVRPGSAAFGAGGTSDVPFASRHAAIGSCPGPRPATRFGERGSALLVLLTLIVLASATVLLAEMQRAAADRTRDAESTLEALAAAKLALIGYATNDDNRPGELPCPDSNHDGQVLINEDFAGGGTCTSLRGWFPWHLLRVEDLRDSSGARLWYAVSADYRAGAAAVMNSETPGQLAVDTASDVVAVVIATGAPVADQGDRPEPDDKANSDAAADADKFLEDANADADLATYVTGASGGGEFNDRVLAITRRELMAAVEKRVLGDALEGLRRYRTRYGVYPWASPFADPRQSAPGTLDGTAAGGSSGLRLVDTSVDFVAAGVAPGDVLVNETDLSRGRVETVGVGSANELTVAYLRGGSANAFSPGDTYSIGRFNGVDLLEGHLPYHLVGEAFATRLDVDWSVREADGADVTVSGGLFAPYANALRAFAEGSVLSKTVEVPVEEGVCVWGGPAEIDCHGVRPPADLAAVYFEGQATKSHAVELEDTTREFEEWGVSTGSIVENIDDGSSGIVVDVDGDTLTVDALQGGTNNAFAAGDGYRVRVPTRTTPVGVADPGSAASVLQDNDQDFVALGVKIGDTIEVNGAAWGTIVDILSSTRLRADGVSFTPGDDYLIRYAFVDRREYEFALEYGGTGVAVFGGTREVCNATPECTVAGTAEAGSTDLTLVDSSADFSAVDVGDMVENESDDSRGRVEAVGAGSLTVSSLRGGIDNRFEPGDGYRVHLSDSLPASAPEPVVLIRDRDQDNAPVATASVTLPTDTVTGTIHVRGVHADPTMAGEGVPDGDEDLPAWFGTHRWHGLVYLALADRLPGSCTPGTTCLELVDDSGPSDRDDVEALVLATGDALSDQDRVAGTPLCGFLCDYLEDENAEGLPLVFKKDRASAEFNDQPRLIPRP